MFRRVLAFTAFFAATAAPAFAHLDPNEHGSLVSGFIHPLSGADHMLAMIAVGLWAAQMGGKARWAVPAAFVLVMALGFVLALAGVPLPFAEPAILASVVGLGLLVALAVRVPASASAGIVGIFALFHGYAHGGELGSATAMSFGIGFVLATAALHAVGLTLGLMIARHLAVATRLLGAVTTLAGAYLIAG